MALLALTTSAVEIAQALQAKLQDNSETIGLNAVYYGDQDKLTTAPVACVEPDTKSSEYKGGGRTTNIIVTTYVLVYSNFVRSGQLNRIDADLLAEAVETVINADSLLGGRVTDLLVTHLQSGYATKASNLVRATRITVESKTQARLPMAS